MGGLRSIIDQEPNQRLRLVVEDMARQIEGGNMTHILSKLASMFERQYEMTKNVKGALM